MDECLGAILDVEPVAQILAVAQIGRGSWTRPLMIMCGIVF